MKTRTARKNRRKSGARIQVLIRGRAVSRSLWQALWQRLKETWRWFQARQHVRMANKSLRVEENVSLGMKRFVAVVKVGDQRFLLGGGGNDVALLASLAPEQTFRDALRDSGRLSAASIVPPAKVRPSRTKATGAGKCA